MQTFIISFITNQAKIILYYTIISRRISIWKGGCQSPNGVPEHSWSKSESGTFGPKPTVPKIWPTL